MLFYPVAICPSCNVYVLLSVAVISRMGIYTPVGAWITRKFVFQYKFCTPIPLWGESLTIGFISSLKVPHTQKRLRSLVAECHLEFLQYSVIHVNRDRPYWLNTEIHKSRTPIVMVWGWGLWGKDKKDRGRVGLVWHLCVVFLVSAVTQCSLTIIHKTLPFAAGNLEYNYKDLYVRQEMLIFLCSSWTYNDFYLLDCFFFSFLHLCCVFDNWQNWYKPLRINKLKCTFDQKPEFSVSFFSFKRNLRVVFYHFILTNRHLYSVGILQVSLKLHCRPSSSSLPLP